MRILQVGLGSMGKRRIRCMHALGYRDILCFDPRQDRRQEAETKYGVATTGDLCAVDFNAIKAMIISTPPDKHDPYIALAVKKRIPAFVEASVVLGRLQSLERKARAAKTLIVPSVTLKFHPAIRFIYSLVDKGQLGKITNFSYHSGQYLPDWHPFENVKSFYVSKKATGAAREIVPFELGWILGLTGFPVKAYGLKGMTMDVGADIDDTYVAAFKFPKGVFGTLTVDVVCRYATRSLILNFEQGQVLWRWDQQWVNVFDTRTKKWRRHSYTLGKAARGYNKNISENMYIDELKAFFGAVMGKKPFPNTFEEDIRTLKLLEALEHAPK